MSTGILRPYHELPGDVTPQPSFVDACLDSVPIQVKVCNLLQAGLMHTEAQSGD